MKKHQFYIIILSLFFALLFNECKKYPDGGFVRQTCKNLFGGSKAGNSKTWKLKYYEVNGIDSTHAIQGANTVPDFYSKFITFKYSQSDPSIKYTAETGYYSFLGSIGTVYKEILFASTHYANKEDSLQCYSINNSMLCVRNILMPEIPNKGLWKINKLTNHEFIFSIQLKNSYKITLTQ